MKTAAMAPAALSRKPGLQALEAGHSLHCETGLTDDVKVQRLTGQGLACTCQNSAAQILGHL